MNANHMCIRRSAVYQVYTFVHVVLSSWQNWFWVHKHVHTTIPLLQIAVVFWPFWPQFTNSNFSSMVKITLLYLSCPIGTVLVVKIVTKIPYLGFNFRRILLFGWPLNFLHCKKHSLFWQLQLLSELQLLTRNSPLWQPAMAIQQTWSAGTA